jgi:hypothetical protein
MRSCCQTVPVSCEVVHNVDDIRSDPNEITIFRLQVLEPDMRVASPHAVRAIQIREFAYKRSWNVPDAWPESIIEKPGESYQKNGRKYEILEHVERQKEIQFDGKWKSRSRNIRLIFVTYMPIVNRYSQLAHKRQTSPPCKRSICTFR